MGAISLPNYLVSGKDYVKSHFVILVITTIQVYYYRSVNRDGKIKSTSLMFILPLLLDDIYKIFLFPL